MFKDLNGVFTNLYKPITIKHLKAKNAGYYFYYTNRTNYMGHFKDSRFTAEDLTLSLLNVYEC